MNRIQAHDSDSTRIGGVTSSSKEPEQTEQLFLCIILNSQS